MNKKRIILFDKENNLLENAGWAKKGYLVSGFLNADEYEKLCRKIFLIIKKAIDEEGINSRGFSLEDYHKYVLTDLIHKKILKRIGYIRKAEELGSLSKRITEKVGKLCSIKDYKICNYNYYHIRIVRPLSNDNNPLHKDVWLDRLKNAVNIYVPLAGSNKRSSLKLIPGSHLWEESIIERTPEGAFVNGIKYTVPAVLNIKEKNYKIIRPNPTKNQLLIFTPYMIHGGADNQNKNLTRVSLEMRFWKQGE